MQSHELLPLLPFLSPEALARLDLPTPAEIRSTDGPRTFLLRGGELAALKARAASDPVLAEGLSKLRELADAELAKPPVSVTDKASLMPGCGPNDYVSHAIYYWPNPARTSGIPYVRRDGEVNPEALDDNRFDAKRFERFVNSLFVLSLAHYLTNDARYAEHAASLLRAWFITPATRQNPHFRFAQIVTGSKSERPPGLIESRRFIYALDAEAMLRGSDAWSENDQAAMRDWFAAFFQWFRTSTKGVKAASSENNLALWCDVQSAIYALYLEEFDLAESIVSNSVAARVPGQIEPDGAQPHELVRAHPYDYVAFNLLAMMGIARAGEAVGFDAWWSETADGRSFGRAMDWLLRIAGPDRLPQGLDQTARLALLEAQNATLKDLEQTLKSRTAALEIARTRADEAERLADELTRTLKKRELPIQKKFDEASAAIAARDKELAAAEAKVAQSDRLLKEHEVRLAEISDALTKAKDTAKVAAKRAEEAEGNLTAALSRAGKAEGEATSTAKRAEAAEKELAAAAKRQQEASNLLAKAQTQERALRAELGALTEKLRHANVRVSEMLTSTSWRVTEPLRQAARLVRGDVVVAAPAVVARLDGSEQIVPIPSVVPSAPPVSAKYANGADASRQQVLPANSVKKTPVRPTKVAEHSVSDVGSRKDYLMALQEFVPELEKSALRHRALPARDFLARIATGGRNGYDDVEAVLESGRSLSEGLNISPSAFNPRALRMLARVVGNQEITPLDHLRSIATYRAFIEMFGEAALRAIDHVLLVDLLMHEGMLGEAMTALERSNLAQEEPVEYAILRANLLHPSHAGRSQERWVEALSAIFTNNGFAPIAIDEGEGPPLARLRSSGAQDIDGPMVSVLMTTFEPDDSLSIAVQSVLSQTWRNLELIISDDFSSEQAFARVKAWEERDPRVKVLRMERNGGTYVAKNQGLHIARGAFVTCHDSDDWSHPQKIERQAQALVADPALIGNMGAWTRASPDLMMQRFSGTGRIGYPNTSSLMFRREPVLERCGYWDSVRTGADSELYRRIENVFGVELPVYGEPLSFGQVREGALTHQSLGNGWESSKRKFYRSAWRHWHKRSAKSRSSMRVELSPMVRPFYAPANILPDRPAPEAKAFDVVIASDFRMEGGSTTSSIEEIKANQRAGLKTAICQINSYRAGVVGKDFLDRRLLELLHQGAVEEIDLDEDVTCKLLMLRYPPILQFVEGLRSGIKAEQVRIVVNQPPSELDGSDRRYEPGVCARNAGRLFGKHPIWMPIGLLARESIKGLVSEKQIAPADWHNVIDVDEWLVERGAFVADRPVIGRHSRDAASKWPEDAATLRAVYPTDGSMYVRILGGAASAFEVLGETNPQGWDVSKFDTTAPKTFLASIDYFVYFHHSQRVEAFGRTIIEAMGAGCVVILPRHFEPVFGAGALYCEPQDVQKLIRSLYANPDRHFEQSRRGLAFARENFSYAVHESRVRAIIGEA